MKPPPRNRVKPSRSQKQELEAQSRTSTQWQRSEQRKLLAALKMLYARTKGGVRDIDYEFLKKEVPSRSVAEIHSFLEYLKTKVITKVALVLAQKKGAEKKTRQPLEEWTLVASAVAGNREEPVSAAFSQVLLVSSTEPCTLRSCYPAQVHKPPTHAQAPAVPILLVRPHSPVQVPASSSSSPTPPLSTVAAPAHVGISCATRKDAPRICINEKSVNFEKIYRFLSVIHKQDNESRLTPMESAIVLDLLMSLPEELSLLDCTSLHKHLLQVYECLSSPGDSEQAKALSDMVRTSAQKDAASGGSTTDGKRDAAPNPGSTGATDRGKQRQSAESTSTGREPETDVVGLCPPLNPLLVPLKLLMRKSINQ